MKLHSLHSLHNLPDIDLIPLCLQHQRSAWEEFFKRFSPLIKKTIRRTFIKCGAGYLAEDIDNIWDIHAVIVEKLYAKGALNQCVDISGLRSWIVRVTANQTVDWLKHRGRIKNLPLIKEEQLMRSLSSPIGDSQEFTLQDVIEDEDADLFAQLEQAVSQLYTECVIEQIAGIDNPTHRWILRLHILGQLSISETELEGLLTISPLTKNEMEERLHTLESALSKKELERQDDLGRTVLFWHQLRTVENKITRLNNDTFSDHTLEISELRQEWTDLGTKKQDLLSSCRLLPKPTNREIAEIMGIPEDKCGNVSKYLERSRESLRKKISSL